MKKCLSLLLCMIMLLSLSLSAFAEPPEATGTAAIDSIPGNEPGAEPMASCTHEFAAIKGSEGYTNQGSAGCQHYTEYLTMCIKCGLFVTSNKAYDSSITPHTGGTLTRATCNGGKQTWYYTSCSNCHSSYTKSLACPGGNHGNGPCNWLPLSLEPPLVTE